MSLLSCVLAEDAEQEPSLVLAVLACTGRVGVACRLDCTVTELADAGQWRASLIPELYKELEGLV